MLAVRHFSGDPIMEHTFGGPLGTLFVGLGLGAFYTALIWINVLLGFFVTPLFIVPLTWVQDAIMAKRAAASSGKV
jgi:hypothetical protein